MIRHLLLEPVEPHREALIGYGPGPLPVGVPLVSRAGYFEAGFWSTGYGPGTAGWDAANFTHALALAFEGQPTGPEGLARALAVLAARVSPRAKRNLTFKVYPPGSRGSTLAGWTEEGLRIDTPQPPAWLARLGWDGESVFGGESLHFDLPVPPDDVGDLRDLWALGTVGEAHGLWRLVVVR
jgi:hypothetical protein